MPDAVLAAADGDPAIADVLERMEADEWYVSNRYTARVHRAAAGHIEMISVRRNDRKALHDWRDLQRIKNELAGPETEALELYPAESRLVDSANQYWLWCMPPGIVLPVGFTERLVTDKPDPRFPGSVQRPFSKEDADEDETARQPANA